MLIPLSEVILSIGSNVLVNNQALNRVLRSDKAALYATPIGAVVKMHGAITETLIPWSYIVSATAAGTAFSSYYGAVTKPEAAKVDPAQVAVQQAAQQIRKEELQQRVHKMGR